MTHDEGHGLCLTLPVRAGAPTIAQAETVFVGGRRATSIRLEHHAQNRRQEITLVTSVIPAGEHVPPSGRRLACTAAGDAPSHSDYARVCQLTQVCGETVFLVTAYRSPGSSPSCNPDDPERAPRRRCLEAQLLTEGVACHDRLAGLSLSVTSARNVSIARLDLEPGYQPCGVAVVRNPERSSDTFAASWSVTTGDPNVLSRIVVNDRAPARTGAVVGAHLGDLFGARREWLRLQPSSDGPQVFHRREVTSGAHIDFEAECRGSCGDGSLSAFRGVDFTWEPELLWMIRGSAGVAWLPERGTFGGLFDLSLPLFRLSGEAFLAGLHLSASRVESDYFFTFGAAVELDLSYLWRQHAGGRDRDVQLVIGVHLGLAAAVITDGPNTFVAPGFDLTPYIAPRLRLGANVFLEPRLEVGWALGDTTRLRASAAMGGGVQW